MKSFAAAILIGATSAVSTVEIKFMKHLTKFGKTLESTEEFQQRLAYFNTLDQFIEEHNAGDHSFQLGHN